MLKVQSLVSFSQKIIDSNHVTGRYIFPEKIFDSNHLTIIRDETIDMELTTHEKRVKLLQT